VKNNDVLLEIATAIADGTPVQWDNVSSVLSPDELDALDGLRTLGRLAEARRDGKPTQASNQSPSPVSPAKWGPLTIIECVGQGKFGNVYRAWDPRLEREVALKILHREQQSPTVAAIAIEEARLLARVHHANVVTVYGAERIDGQVGVWMEFVKGRTLEDDLVQQGPFSPERVASVGIDLASALAAVHKAGVIHRDVKSQNVMIDVDGRVLLADFGAGCEHFDSFGTDRRTLVGTPLYVAPETLDGTPPGPASDVYSLGVLLFHLATGRYPASGESAREIVEQRRKRPTSIVDVRPDFPPALASIVERAMSADLRRRYQTADELRNALEDFLQTLRHQGGGRPGIARYKWPAAVCALLFAGAAIAGVTIVNTRHEGPAIAVMPLKYLDSGQDAEEFADGVTSGIIQQLGTIRGLAVRSQISSSYFKRQPRNPQEVAKQLGVNFIVEGTLQTSDTTIRANIQLVRASTDQVVWSGRFERDLRAGLALEDDICRAVVNELRLKAKAGQRRYEMNSDVYEEYLSARAVLDHKDRSSLNRAKELFQYVIGRDSTFAPAFAGLAVAEADLAIASGAAAAGDGDELNRLYGRVADAATKAQQLDPLLPDASAAIGIVQARNRQWALAVASFERAIQLNPNMSRIRLWYANWVLMQMGEFDKALQQLQLAQQSDPFSLDVRRVKAMVEVMQGRYEEAIDDCRYVMSKEPTFPFVKGYLIRALWFSGKTGEATQLAQEEGRPRSRYGFMAAVPGARSEQVSQADTREFVKAASVNPVAKAMVFAALGDNDRAFAALEALASKFDPAIGSFTFLPDLAPLKQDPRFSIFRERLGLANKM